MTPFNLEWWFHWTHDEAFVEVLKVSIPALGSILAALIAWYGIRRTAKVTQEALENSKEATPPELLRLEKWSSILKDSNDYPENIKHELDVNAIQSTYIEYKILGSCLRKLGKNFCKSDQVVEVSIILIPHGKFLRRTISIY